MASPDFDVATAQRWFAIELNNATWDWLDANQTGAPTDPIVHVAHASLHHWRDVGTVINQARAMVLVANVHACLGHGDIAAVSAEECMRLTLEAADAADWDRAFAHDVLARVAALTGDPAAAERKAEARHAGDAIVDPGSKEVFDAWHSGGNWHGLT